MSLLKSGKKQSLRIMKNVKSKNSYGIKTPQNVEEFRNNLKKYYVCIGENNDELYVQNCDTDRVNVNNLNSIDDLYKRCNTKHFNPQLSPKVNPIKDYGKFMEETEQIFSTNGYFKDNKNYEVIEDDMDFISNYNPLWVGLDNQIYREFFHLTLGKFSGYVESNKE